MGAAEHKAKDAATAAYMKAHPGAFPDSVMRPWGGNGASYRAMAAGMGHVENQTSLWSFGMLGGVLAARLGYSDYGIPPDIRRAAE